MALEMGLTGAIALRGGNENLRAHGLLSSSAMVINGHPLSPMKYKSIVTGTVTIAVNL
jgi:hypothetical protein